MNVQRYLARVGRARAGHPRLPRARAAHGARGPGRRDAGDAAAGRRPGRARSTSGRWTSWPGCGPGPSATPTRAAWPSGAASTGPSTAGSSTTSGSGCSRPGRGRRSRPPSGRRWIAPSTPSPGRWPPSRAASPTVTTSRETSWCCPGGEQAVIDFQDALLGPRQYDLVALLRDSYVELPPELVDRMLRALPGAPRGRGRAAPRPGRLPRHLRPAHRAAEAQGRRPLRLHRPGARQPGLPGLDPGVAALRPRGASRAGPTWRALQRVLARHVPSSVPEAAGRGRRRSAAPPPRARYSAPTPR